MGALKDKGCFWLVGCSCRLVVLVLFGFVCLFAIFVLF